MGFWEAIGSFFKNYVTFSGRASRSEYWYTSLFLFIIGIVLIVIRIEEQKIGYILKAISDIILFLPSLSLCIRRLHDINWSGWGMLLIFPLFIAMFARGTKGENRFGADPLQNNLDPYDTHKQRQNFNPYIPK